VQVEAVDAGDRRVYAVEANDREILIFRPDAALEAAAAGLGKRRHVKHDAAHLTEEFAAHVVELVVLPVEPVGVDVDHLQEAFRHVGRGEHPAHVNERIHGIELALPRSEHRVIDDAAREVGLPEEVVVLHGYRTQLLVGLHFLNVGLDDRAEPANRRDFFFLASDHAVDGLIHGDHRSLGRRARGLLRLGGYATGGGAEQRQ